MKDFNYTLNIDSSLLKDDMTLEQFLVFNAFNQDQYTLMERPRADDTYSILSLKDKNIANRMINVFLDMCGNKLHVTSISTPDSMVVRLSH